MENLWTPPPGHPLAHSFPTTPLESRFAPSHSHLENPQTGFPQGPKPRRRRMLCSSSNERRQPPSLPVAPTHRYDSALTPILLPETGQNFRNGTGQSFRNPQRVKSSGLVPQSVATRAGSGSEARSAGRYRRARKRVCRDGRWGVGATHSTYETGEPSPKGPGGGKGSPG
jgi:hypothetical protein